MTSCREQLGNTGGVEASLGQTEGSTQTGTTGTDNDGIVLVILRKLESIHLQPFHITGSTYNDWVLVRNVAIGLAGAQRLVCPYPGWRKYI